MPKMQARRERVLSRRYARVYLDDKLVGWRTEKQVAEIMTYNTKRKWNYADRESAYRFAPVEGE